jgi:peptidoglycan/LPS O-acetylase OafA/YrhL
MAFPKLSYRSEIDGLRAVAVLPVILFHTGLHWMPGGYVGVDVFFVISGFLITGILMRELEGGTFSILSFYERRARRILPALFLVMAVTAILAMVFMLPYELRDLGRSMIAVLAFISNIFFWDEANYFATAAERLPLLHTWSLSVEEQFYILFPIVLWLFWKYWRKGLVPAMIVVSLASLVLAEVVVHRSPSTAFYLLPTRGWELLAGSLAAVYLSRRAALGRLSGEISGGVGLLAIFYSILFFDEATPFPSVWALVPVLGTVGILIGASGQTLVGRILSFRPAVFVGLISYSAYLWHQPLFAFARITTSERNPTDQVMIGLAVLSLILAWGTWRFIEQPFRQKNLFDARQVFIYSSFGAATLAGMAAIFIFTQGFAQRFPENMRSWLVKTPAEYGDYVRTGHGSVLNAPLSDSRPNLVLIGDSFSQDFYNMVTENSAFADYSISTIYIPARCQLSFAFSWEDVNSLIRKKDRALCSKRSLTGKQEKIIQNANVVIFAFSWRDWSASRMAEVLQNFDLDTEQTAFVIGSKRFLSRKRVLQLDDPVGSKIEPSAKDSETSRILGESLPDGVFIDTMALLCPNECPLFTPDGELISHDGSHLTQAGARYVGEVLFAAPPLAIYRH